MSPAFGAAAVFVLTVSVSYAVAVKVWGGELRAAERLCVQQAGPGPRFRLRWMDLLAWAARLKSSAAGTSQLRTRLMAAGYTQEAAVDWFHGAQVTGGLVCGIFSVGAAAGLGLEGTSFLALTMGASLFGLRLPGFYLARRRSKRVRELQRALPNAVDLMIVSIESGLGLDHALRTVARELAEAHPDLTREFVFLGAEIAAGKTRAEALRNLAERTAVDEIRDLTAALIQADRFGTSICQALRTRAEFMRVQARHRAEEKAAKLAVKLILPIFFCVLPALFVVTLGPAIFKLMTELVPLIDKM